MSHLLSWSIRLPDDDASERAFDDLVDLCRELLLQHFAPSSGYETRGTRLGGPIEGVHWSIARGTFIAELGLQRFLRAHQASDPKHLELRLVATARAGGGAPLDPAAMERHVMGWAVAGWSTAFAAWGVLLSLGGGVLSGATQALLAVPALVGWRALLTSLAGRSSGSTRALAAAKGPTSALPATQQHAGLDRWEELLPHLRAQLELLQNPTHAPPFRAPGDVEAANQSPAARARFSCELQSS